MEIREKKRRKDKKEREEEKKKGRREEGRTGGLPAHLWDMLTMLRTARFRLEVKDTRDPARRRMGLGLPVGHRNQFRLVVSWLVRRVRFRVSPGV